MKIGVIPTIRIAYKNQFEYSVDIRLINFIKKIFSNSEIDILINNKKEKIDFLCISGGNDILKFNSSKKNLIRFNLDKYYYDICKKKQIPILGICHGAQFIASQEGATITRKNSIRSHKIKFNKQIINLKSRTVNSYHNFVINKLGTKLDVIAFAHDQTIEAFVDRKNKILGLMWHPEREKKINVIDEKIIKEFL